MNYLFKIVCTLLVFSNVLFSKNELTSNTEIDIRINDLISRMTIEEKVGQMTQLTLAVVSKPRNPGSFEMVLDSLKLREALLKYHVGSILNTGGMANTLQNWNDIISGIQDVALKESRLAIPVIYGIDAIHGANYIKNATLFPQSIAMAATFNPDLLYQSAAITALELRASGIPWNFNPVLGLARNPAWPRFWETFGEDPYLAAELGKAYIKGMEGDNNETRGTKVAACMKHFIGYSMPLNGRDRTPAWIPERMLRDIFLPPFKAAVDAGVATVMINSSEINGIPVHSDYNLLTKLLRQELGFKGLAVSDWEDVIRLHERDRVADSAEEAVRMAVMAGIDMSMVPNDYSFAEILVKLVREGKVPQSRIDEAVARILRVKMRAGLFENPYPDKTLKDKFATVQASQLNLAAAHEAITLLKNTNSILPLDKTQKVLVSGPNASQISRLNGGWSTTWQGGVESTFAEEKLTVFEAIQQKIGKDNVCFSAESIMDTTVDIDAALAASENADIIILCLGENTYCETPGNINDINLPRDQIDLAKEMYKTGKPVIIILIEGRPRIIREIVKDAQAVIMAYLPGNEGGQAIADVIFGETNPSGKLPFTYPDGPNGHSTYDRKPLEQDTKKNYGEQFAFGHGLSYTTFKYSDLELNQDEFGLDDEIKISVKVKNSGNRPGKETVLLFTTDMYGSVSRPVRELKRFTKVHLKAGEQETVNFILKSDDFAFTGRNNTKKIEPGLFRIQVAGLIKEFNLNLKED